MQDAYNHACENREDPTGELSRVENGAARFDVPLPPDYWRRRSRLFEDELEAEIDELIQSAMSSRG